MNNGRNIAAGLGTLSGEGSGQLITQQHAGDQPMRAWKPLPESTPADPSYYDRALLKAPVWKLYIPGYYFVGGFAGAALAFGAAAQLDGNPELKDLIARSHWVGIIGSSIGAGFLILDLGRPTRFLNMLRVFRPTSPMNMGAWLLAGTPPAAILAGIPPVGQISGYIAGLLGLGLCTYTGVLVSNSVVPVWNESRRVLPLLFGASGMSAAGSILKMFDDNPRATRSVRNFALLGACAELVGSKIMEQQASARSERVGAPLREGVSGALWKAAGILTVASVVTALLPNQTKAKRVTGGIFGALGSLALRLAVHYAGEHSAKDPRASFHLQRAKA
jgi:formate-dependent nitrite reductase membrane component NrfD